MLGSPLPLGSQAPEFTVNDHEGRSVSLSALRGCWVVLVFYPGDDTPTCTCQLRDLREAWEDLRDAGAVVYGVNPFSEDSHGRFARKLALPFPLLVDRGGRMARLFRSGFWLLVRRTVYVIDPQGRIAFAQRGQPSPAQLLSIISPGGHSGAPRSM